MNRIMKQALDTVNEKILTAVQKRCSDVVVPRHCRTPRLIAVSKIKPINDLIEAYNCGQRYFGENYIKELEFKSNSQHILEQCPQIKFHFIGHLQASNVNTLLRVKKLHMIETIHSIKLADKLDKAIEKRKDDPLLEPVSFVGGDESNTSSDRIKVLIQVNTSGEDTKNGVDPENVTELAQHILANCRWLQLAGFMTIGRYGGWPEESGPNKDFIRLNQVRETVAKNLGLNVEDFELSMGMSGDFQEAIELGSTNVRVGTMIFGERPPKGQSSPISNEASSQ